jgi:hypothetical protein
MKLIIGPILKRAGGYVFDTWSAGGGLDQGYSYRRIEDASYARNAAIRTVQSGTSPALGAVVCHTLDEFLAQTEGCAGLAAA